MTAPPLSPAPRCRWMFLWGAVVGALAANATDYALDRAEAQRPPVGLRVTHCTLANYGPKDADVVLSVAFDTAGASAYLRRVR